MERVQKPPLKDSTSFRGSASSAAFAADPASSMAPVFFREPNRMLAATISVLVSLFVFGIKAYAYALTHSAAVLSDALESIVNVVAALIGLIVIRFVAEPADREHPYGHGKAEFFSAALEGGLVFAAALMIFFEGVVALVQGRALNQLGSGMAVVAIAGVINLLLGFYLKRVGKKENSDALVASGTHVLSDVWTTVGVLGGLLVVWLTGIIWIDAAIALGVGTYLGWSGYQIVVKSLGALIDAADEGVLEELVRALNDHRRIGIINIHHLRAIRAGRFHHIDAHLVVPEFWQIAQAHQTVQDYELQVVRQYRFDGEIAFHLDPCKKKYCTVCDYPECPLRIQEFQQQLPFQVTEAVGAPPE